MPESFFLSVNKIEARLTPRAAVSLLLIPQRTLEVIRMPLVTRFVAAILLSLILCGCPSLVRNRSR